MTNLFDINLNRLVVFVAVVETGSITAAAKRLGLAKTMVSAHMQKLEAEIGSQLIVRTTRRLHLTEAGNLFYESCQKILLDTENAIALASSNSQQLRGKLRISTSIDFGVSVIAPLAAELVKQYPDLRIEILSSDERMDMVGAGIDVAIRIGRLTDSSHRAALITYFEDWLVVHPSLLNDGVPTSPADLAGLPFVGLSVLSHPIYWSFTQTEKPSESVRFNASVMANTASAVKAAVLAGAGMMVQPDVFVKDDIAAGRLVRLLPEWSLPGGGIYAVYPQSVQRSQKVSVFIAALKERYA